MIESLFLSFTSRKIENLITSMIQKMTGGFIEKIIHTFVAMMLETEDTNEIWLFE